MAFDRPNSKADSVFESTNKGQRVRGKTKQTFIETNVETRKKRLVGFMKTFYF